MATVPAALPARGRADEPEWTVWLTVAIALAIGAFVAAAALDQMQTASAGVTKLSYPAPWVETREDGAVFAAADLAQGGPFGARVVVRDVPAPDILPSGGPVMTAATNWSVTRGAGLLGYRVLDIREEQVGGRDGATVEYAYLATGAPGAPSGGMPRIMHATDTIVTSGGRYYILTFAAEQREFPRLTTARFPQLRSVRTQVVQSWQLP